MTTVEIFATDDAEPGLLPLVRRMLDSAFAGTLSDDDWQHTLGGWHVIVRKQGRLLAHASVVPRALVVDHECFDTGYVEGVATAPDQQGQGFGSIVVARVNELVRARFEMGALSTDRQAFYTRLGWEPWQGPSFVRHDDGRLVRTADEDDGIMVLRFGPSSDVDLGAALTCRARSGDDW